MQNDGLPRPLREGVGGGGVASTARPPPPNPLPQGEGEAAANVAAFAADIAARTDSYFNRTRRIVARFGDKRVTYAVFMRRPVIAAPRLMVEWLQAAAASRGTSFEIELMYPEGTWVGAGEPLAYITGSLVQLSDLETILLQKIGPASVAAHNTYQMCLALPQVGFLAMEARHCAGAEMQDMMGYAASVGSEAAKREGAKGFIGNANDGTAHWYGTPRGFGTMPHSLIGYAGSTLRAAEMFRETFPDEPMTVLADYFGREISDALAVCSRFPDLAGDGRLSFRLDTHGGRFMEGLDPAESYAVLERNAPSGRHRGVRRGDLADARGARCGRPSPCAHRCVIGIRRGEVPGDGGCEGTDRCGRHRQLHPGCLARDLRDGRHCRL
jgi:nicotinate phosphoribosyltransferase